jgi:DNA-nicking Smr family endonuclease
MRHSAHKKNPPGRTQSCGNLGQLYQLLQASGLSLKNPAPVNPCPRVFQPPVADDSDDVLFYRAMAGVKRISWQMRSASCTRVPFTFPAGGSAEDSRMMQDALRGKPTLDLPDHPEYLEAWVSVAGKRFLPKLRSGLYSIQGQLDLHGMNQAQARQQVEQFIFDIARFRSCCVKIIHGRGINSRYDRAVLKEKLQRWLSTRRMSRHVLAYASAPFKDGGVGALYVLLRHQ